MDKSNSISHSARCLKDTAPIFGFGQMRNAHDFFFQNDQRSSRKIGHIRFPNETKNKKEKSSLSSLAKFPSIYGLLRNEKSNKDLSVAQIWHTQNQINLQRRDSVRYVGTEINQHNGGTQVRKNVATRRMALAA